MGCIYDDTKRRFLREGREEGLIEGREEGRIEGRMEQLCQNIIAIMSELDLTADKAMDILRVPDEEREVIKERLNT